MKKLFAVTVLVLIATLCLPYYCLASTADAEKYIAEAEQFLQSGGVDDALRSFDKAIAADPDMMKAYIYKGLILSQLQRYDEATRVYQAALARDNQCLPALLRLSSAQYAAKEYDSTLATLDRVISISPNNARAHYVRACLYALANQPGKAGVDLKRAVELYPPFKLDISEDKDLAGLKNLDWFKKLAGIDVRVDGTPLEMDVPPLVVEGRTLVPLRAVFESLGTEVDCDGVNRTATGTKGDKKIEIKIDSREARIDGEVRELDVPAQVIDGRTLVPLRFISEALGAEVGWAEDTRTVFVTTAPAPSPDYQKGEAFSALDQGTRRIVVDGMYDNPYNMPPTTARVYLIADTEKTRDLFLSLRPEDQKEYMNDRVQKNWGEVIGCEQVEVYLVFDRKYYASLTTSYNAAASDLKLSRFRNGVDTDVALQDKEKNTYQDYYFSLAGKTGS